MRGVALGDIADFLGCPLEGDSSHVVDSVAPLRNATSTALAFLDASSHLNELKTTQAGLVLLRENDAPLSPVPYIITSNPKLSYARVLTWMLERSAPPMVWGIHPTAILGQNFKAPAEVFIGPYVVIGNDVTLEEGVILDPGVVIGDRCSIGAKTHLHARVTVANDVKLGHSCRVHSGTVLGSSGFGFANDKGRWMRIPQVGGLVIGDNVEIGANTTVDCGAQTPTIISDGVILDNQIQIGHNVTLGKSTAIAGCVGVAGSTTIGSYCMIGGGSGIGGHLNICSGVQISGMTGVSQSISEPGMYSSGTLTGPMNQWKRNALRFNKLEELVHRVRVLEKQLEAAQRAAGDIHPDNTAD